MKKIIFISAAIFFLYSGLLVQVKALTPTSSIKETSSSAENKLVTDENTESQAENTTKVDYVLPYPGILPDNPIYFLKDLRDKIMEMLIADPVKKMEFHLLQSDKFIGMALSYEGQGKWDKVTGMLDKSNLFMEKTVQEAGDIKTKGLVMPGYQSDRIGKSIAKHIEIALELLPKAGNYADNVKLFDEKLESLSAAIAKNK
jgi:hypothetical protein